MNRRRSGLTFTRIARSGQPSGWFAARRRAMLAAAEGVAAWTEPGRDWRERAGEIAEAAARAGRDAAAVRLVAVSKTFDAAAIEPVLQAGQREFGENRVQEAQAKWPRLRALFPDLDLQPDRAAADQQGPRRRRALRRHPFARPRQARGVARRRNGAAGEDADALRAGEYRRGAAEIRRDAAEGGRLRAALPEEHGLAIAGLMCIPPAEADPAPHFDMLRRLGDALELPSLSMGMSADFETAIEHGATHVRVGSAIFGSRE